MVEMERRPSSALTYTCVTDRAAQSRKTESRTVNDWRKTQKAYAFVLKTYSYLGMKSVREDVWVTFELKLEIFMFEAKSHGILLDALSFCGRFLNILERNNELVHCIDEGLTLRDGVQHLRSNE